VPERPHFIVHNEGDNVGVVVVEDAKAGQELAGWIMETDRTITVKALAEVPLGHKVAMKDIANGATIIKYEHDIGRAVEDIPAGGYVHAHNIKTKRW
jgi:(2R)-sulfolactate sulfo-lyase subunit alpha